MGFFQAPSSCRPAPDGKWTRTTPRCRWPSSWGPGVRAKAEFFQAPSETWPPDFKHPRRPRLVVLCPFHGQCKKPALDLLQQRIERQPPFWRQRLVLDMERQVHQFDTLRLRSPTRVVQHLLKFAEVP